MGFPLFQYISEKLGFRKSSQVERETIPTGTIEKEFGVEPVASRVMEDNINLWYAMYKNQAPWLNCDVRSLGLPGAIGRELSRHALTEFSVAVSGSSRATYIDEQVQLAEKNFGNELELGLCLGGIALKPYPDEKGRVLVDAYTTRFTPTRFDGTGKVIGGVFQSAPLKQDKQWYIRLEYHDFVTNDDGTTSYVIENKAFMSGQNGGIGAEVSLGSVKAWRGMLEHVEIENLDWPLFAYFKPPMSNQEDPTSQLGVSVYSGAVKDLIQQADEQWERMWWEFKSGERKIFMDGTATSANQFIDRLFERGTFTPAGDMFEVFSPEFRHTSLYDGLQYILKLIEFNTGLAFGTISDPQSVNKTATEEIMTKHRQYVTEDAIQKAFQATLDGLIYAINALCDLYRLAPAGTYNVDYNWGDGILDDPETRRADMAMDLQLVAAGLMRDVDFIMKWNKVDEETARKMLPGLEDQVTEEQDEVE